MNETLSSRDQSAALASAAEDRIEQACVAFEEAWRAGESPRIEDYLGDDVGNVRAALLRELLLLDLEFRQNAGQAVRPEDYQTRFAADARTVTKAFARHRSRIAPTPAPSAVDTKQGSAAGHAATEDNSDPTAQVGTVLAGKYKLVEQIGEGGMGTVFLAQQTAPVKRTVAVKVVKAGMHSKAALARFDAERQALALMDHPNIAKVLDAGTTEANRPFFVMELVKGTPITQFCDDRKLTPRQRLELFVPVCQAIQHAHQKGVIHRDIKPSNVLVALYNDQPVPKVIDFGVAKATGPSLTDQSLMTGFGAIVGTVQYMSPEQADLDNLDIDTRSDVYSLGVLLYELLTGTTPVDCNKPGKPALLEMLRIVREVEVPRPSAKLSTIDTLPEVAADRGTEPAKLLKLLKGELDWVVLKALEKDRARRYESANALARDIERYFHDEPVEARPPSAGYRLRKFARRNKVPLVTTSLVALALLVGGAVSVWKIFETAEAEGRAKERELMATRAYQEYAKNSLIMNDARNRAKRVELSASVSLNRLAVIVGQHPRLRDPELEPLRRELVHTVLSFWDDGVQLDKTPFGSSQTTSDFYRAQRALCLARVGEHEKASAEAERLWSELSDGSKGPAGQLVFDLVRVSALCAAAAKDDEALAKRYADRAMHYMAKAAAANYFRRTDNLKLLGDESDLDALRQREDFRELHQEATAIAD